MNLHSISRGMVTAINPDTIGIWQQGINYATLADGRQVPVYNPVFNVPIQVQGLSNPDLQLASNLNLQGVLRKVYVYSALSGVNRATLSGGDLLVFGDFQPVPIKDSNGNYVYDSNGRMVMTYQNRYWKVVQVAERWPDQNANGWTSGIVCEQTDSTNFIIDSNGQYLVDSYGNLEVSS